MKPASSDTAYQHIRKSILKGEYKPGQPLLEMELAAKIGVSRTPVRDALRQLEAEGLITIRPRYGASVKDMTMNDFREMCEVRQSLESNAAGLAALRRTDSDLETIKQAYTTMEALSLKMTGSDPEDQSDLKKLIREDIHFHVAIFNASGNELMKKEIMRLHLIEHVVAGLLPAMLRNPFDRGTKAKRDARRQETLSSHQMILTAIVKTDATAARVAMHQHIQEVIDISLLAMARAQGATSTNKVDETDLDYLT